MTQPLKVLFVCEGNLCRSPVAQAVLGHLSRQGGPALDVSSGATRRRFDGCPYHPWMVEIGTEQGFPFEGVSHSVTPEELQGADLVVAMDRRNGNALFEIDPNELFLPKLRLLGEFLPEPTIEIHDPLGGKRVDFADCFRRIRSACEGLLRQLAAGTALARPGQVLRLLEQRPDSPAGKQIEDWSMDRFPKGAKFLWDGGALPEPTRKFELVVARDLLETVLPARAGNVLLQLRKNLAPDGVLLVSAPNSRCQPGRYTAEECEELLSRIFPSVDMMGANYERGLFSRLLHASPLLGRFARKKSDSLRFHRRLSGRMDFALGICRN